MLSNYEERWHKLTRALEAFDLPVVEAAVNILLSLKQFKLTGDDLLTFHNEVGDISAVVNEKYHQEYWRNYGQRCPVCSYWLEYHAIDLPIGRQNLYGYKGIWFCNHCNNEIFTTEELENGYR